MNDLKLNMQMESSSAACPSLQSLNLVDDFLFDAATEDLEACKIIIELSLGISIREIRWKEGQKVLHNLPGKRGIRMDFYVVDMENRIFNVEMQKRNEGNIPKRTRFYQGLVDAPLLKTGERGFDRLNPLYIIVICDFDLYGYNKYRYTFTNRCHEVEGLELGDDSAKIILNTRGSNSDEVEPSLVDFLHYITASNAEALSPACDKRLKHLHDKIAQIKSSEQMEAVYMKMEERDRIIREQAENKGREQGLLEGRAEGREEGREEGRTAAIRSFVDINRNEGVPEKEIHAMLQKFFRVAPEEADQFMRGAD